MTHPRKLVHTAHMPVRWGDMDAMGHVNNTVYFRYMEQARIEWFYAFARELDTKPYAEQGPVIINASCTFLEPLVYPGDVEVKMFLGELGRSSFGSHYEISMHAKRYAEGAAKMVWIDRKTGKSMPLPQPLRTMLEPA
jgi:acyl-CoA thioester hydrolase